MMNNPLHVSMSFLLLCCELLCLKIFRFSFEIVEIVLWKSPFVIFILEKAVPQLHLIKNKNNSSIGSLLYLKCG